MESVKFYDVEGVPVKLVPRADGGVAVIAVDQSGERRFPISAVIASGVEISEEEFNALLNDSGAFV